MFSAKKNKYAKIAVPFTVSKGQALRVFVTISTPRFTSGSILTKNLDSRHFSGCLKSISFFFFFFLSLSGGKNYYGLVSLSFSVLGRLVQLLYFFLA